MKQGGTIYRTPQVAEGKTIWLMATGPGTWCPEQEPLRRYTDHDTILFLQAAPERAVPWAAPQDFDFNPDDPLAGLPRDGFLASFADGHRRFVKPNTPPDVLKAEGGEKVDLDMFTESTMERFFPARDR